MTYLNVKQAMTKTGLKYTTLLKLVNNGKLPARKIPSGKKSIYFFVERELEETIETHRIPML